MLASQQKTNGGTYAFGYSWYNSLGVPHTQSNASTGRTLTWSYDSSGRQNGVQGTTSSASTAYGAIPASQGFWPSGAPQTLNLGGSLLKQTSSYDHRLRPQTLALANNSVTLDQLSYTWYANGNLHTETIANMGIASSITQTLVTTA